MFYKSIKNQPNVTRLPNEPIIKWHFRQGKVIRYKSTYNGISTFTEYQAYDIKPYIVTLLFIAIITFIL